MSKLPVTWEADMLELARQYAENSLYGSPEPPKPTCQKAYRVRDTGPEHLRGQIFGQYEVMTDTWLMVVGLPTGDNIPLRDVELVEAHKFPDTGMQRSWCSCCGVEGRFDWRSGSFKIE